MADQWKFANAETRWFVANLNRSVPTIGQKPVVDPVPLEISLVFWRYYLRNHAPDFSDARSVWNKALELVRFDWREIYLAERWTTAYDWLQMHFKPPRDPQAMRAWARSTASKLDDIRPSYDLIKYYFEKFTVTVREGRQTIVVTQTAHDSHALSETITSFIMPIQVPVDGDGYLNGYKVSPPQYNLGIEIRPVFYCKRCRMYVTAAILDTGICKWELPWYILLQWKHKILYDREVEVPPTSHSVMLIGKHSTETILPDLPDSPTLRRGYETIIKEALKDLTTPKDKARVYANILTIQA